MNCIYPSVIQNPKTRTNMLVPCRKCTACRISKLAIKDKLCREEVNFQIKQGFSSSFVTLTYNEGIPRCGLCPHVYRSFLKRFRINLERSGFKHKIKYIGCGEYGDDNHRPHYHFCFFGLPATSSIRDILRKSWTYGFIQFGALSDGGIRYVLDYVMAQGNSFEDEYSQAYVKQLLYPPFHSSSRGIGSSWLSSVRPFYKEHGYYLDKGKPICLPSYYANRYGLLSDKSFFKPYNYIDSYLRNRSTQTLYNSKGRVHEPVIFGSDPSSFTRLSQRSFESVVDDIIF